MLSWRILKEKAKKYNLTNLIRIPFGHFIIYYTCLSLTFFILASLREVKVELHNTALQHGINVILGQKVCTKVV